MEKMLNRSNRIVVFISDDLDRALEWNPTALSVDN